MSHSQEIRWACIAIALLVLTGCVTRVYVVPCPEKSVGTCNQEQCS